ncbi:hypothetical protein Poli38472_008351 [Pythium oligandrum]|uniref:Uncharacterized protein n=1 Tax=Pythium oligandrum TaxID=41045 RepID=A0A8K1CLH2_PYTOL|nr:hypothetical protein Poli38472_008351 [Pythium oligandrum]|eukprot:TMW65709.1 hypothetical protein Poli38472_008351 [Pythium oligandrum]
MTQRVAKLLSVPLEYPYHGRNNFYVRKCYDKYYQIVEKALMKTDKRCVTVTGTSGIGKSVFYAYFCERFRQAHPDVCVIATAYRTERNCGLAVYNGTDEPIHMSSFFFFDEMLRKALDDAKSAKKQTIFLCDGVPDTLYCGKSVVFTSPDEKWLRHADKYHCTYHMPLWTLDELQEAARELGLPLTNEDMEIRFEIFGGEARHCLFPEKRADFLVSMFEQKIDRIWNPDKRRRLLCDNDPDHRLVHIEANHYGHYQSSKLASPFEVRKLAERMLLLSNSSREAMQLFFSAAGLSTACFEYIAQVDAREAFQLDKLVAVACWNRQRLEKTRNDDVTTITSQLKEIRT